MACLFLSAGSFYLAYYTHNDLQPDEKLLEKLKGLVPVTCEEMLKNLMSPSTNAMKRSLQPDPEDENVMVGDVLLTGPLSTD